MKEGNNDRIKKATKEWRKDESKEQGKQWRNEGMEEAINAERTEEYGFSKEWNSYTTTRNWELLFFVKRELIAFYISRLAPIFDHLLTFPMVFSSSIFCVARKLKFKAFPLVKTSYFGCWQHLKRRGASLQHRRVFPKTKDFTYDVPEYRSGAALIKSYPARWGFN